jgi:L-threonylcarbamoyladenylate synthase
MDFFQETVIGNDIDTAADWLLRGEAVGVPTETVYGLAANALNPDAVTKIFEAKERPQFNPLIVHAASMEAAFSWADEVPPVAKSLAAAFWPGPLTLLLPKKSVVPDIVTAGSGRVGLRVPSHLLLHELLLRLPFPVAAPSANKFGAISPTTATHVAEGLNGRIPYVLDGGQSSVGVESAIVGFEYGEPVLYREGGISIEAIEAVLGAPITKAVATDAHPVAPGRLKSHYAPGTPLYLGSLQELAKRLPVDQCAILCYSGTELKAKHIFILSPSADLHEAAQNLFGMLREADSMGAMAILAEPVPDQGIGRAINDRLSRAQHANK